MNNVEFKKNVGRRIKLCRKAAGLSQSELADKLGVTQNTISSQEAGRSIPGANGMLKVAKAINTTAGYLHYGKHTTGKFSDNQIEWMLLLNELITEIVGEQEWGLPPTFQRDFIRIGAQLYGDKEPNFDRSALKEDIKTELAKLNNVK